MRAAVRSEIAGAPVPAPVPDPAPAPASTVQGGIVCRRELFERLQGAARVTQISAPAGSGKTFLLRSWIADAGLAEHVAWVPVHREERDPQRFWISVADALRGTAAGSELVRPLTVAPDLDGWALVERLLKDLASLEGRIWLVIDDLHELRSADTRAQLELLLMRAPDRLRFVLSARHDLRLGLHRLRLEGELAEIRSADLRFSLDEARALLKAAGVQLSDSALALLHARIEGWVAGLRLAALSLARHPDPERFADEFSGSERTVAEYLLAEVLERLPAEIRCLLLRTSVLERVSGPLADALTGGSGGERILQDLEAAGAFVVALDVRRSWFRYHQLFADLLRLQLRGTAPGELRALHAEAAGWFAQHGHPVDAVRHAQAAEDWSLAARLLGNHCLGLGLNGQGATLHELLTRFPADVVESDAELTALMAGDELNRGSLEEAERHLARATEGLTSVPAERRGRMQVVLTIFRLFLARQRGDLPAVAEEAQRLLAPVTQDPGPGGLGEDLRALALISLGLAELWTARSDPAERHLEQGVALARRIERPYLELTGQAHAAIFVTFRSYARGAEKSWQAIDLAERHGWTEEPITGVAYGQLGAALVAQGRLDEAEPWLERAERTLRPEVEPAAGMTLHFARGAFEMARGRDEQALGAFQAAERLAGLLVTTHADATPIRALEVRAFVRLGDTGRAEAALAAMEEQERQSAEMRVARAVLRLAQDNPQAAAAALAPVVGDSAPEIRPVWLVQALLLEAITREALGDPVSADRALGRALDLAQPDCILFPFLLEPAPELLERHGRHHASHAAMVSEILAMLAGAGAPGAGALGAGVPGAGAFRAGAPVAGAFQVGPPGAGALGAGRAAPPAGDEGDVTVDGQAGGRGWCLREPPSEAETRVLRYLPTNLSAPEIAGELCVSVNTVRTHMRHVYAKLGAHHRTEAVEQARALGLLAPSRRRA